ncbi:MAG TPA: Phenylacetic acid catabolic protein [Candidatus Binataceae bacterium]|nr:Phenylacetic acid catabolic protein [Candidatus Binataceae bacterium]
METPFRDKVETAEVAKMPAEYQDLLKRVLTIQADCEIGGPHLYLENILPALESRLDRLLVVRTAAEEVDHFRQIARLAGDLGADVSFLLSRPNRERYVDAFRGAIRNWEEFAIFGFLIDRVGRYQLEEFVGCSYAPLDRILPQIVTEEAGHIEYGQNLTAEFAARGGQAKEKIQQALDVWYPKALDMFGSDSSRRSERYRHWGLKRRTNKQAREEYIREVNPLIEAMGLSVPDPNRGRKFAN